jgi:ABC-type bacteriocin/lantibiotic exporter with double-glycine peptidase domain
VKTHNFEIKPGINLFEYFIDTQENPDYMVQYIPNKKLQQYSIKTIDIQKYFNAIGYTGARNQLNQDEIEKVNQILVLRGNKYRIFVIYKNEKKEINIDATEKDKVLDLSEYQKNKNVKNIYIEEIKEKKT